ncbi:MAG: DMT family transporter [Gammaproteobacteria bacterium]
MSVPVAFVGVVLIWSTTPLAIQWSSESAGFLFGVTARMLLGLLVCLVVLRLVGISFSWNRAARKTYLVAGLGIYGAMTAVYWSAQFVPSGWIAVIFGLSPLVTGVMSWIWFRTGSLSGLRIVGLLAGVAGLAIMFSQSLELGTNVIAGLAGVFLAVILHSTSAVWVSRLGGDQPALAVTAGGLTVAVPLFVLTWFALDGQWPEAMTDRTRYSIVYLAVFGSVIGFFWYFYLLRHLDVVKVNLLTLVTPVFSLLLGHWLNNEVLNVEVWAGALMIMAGLVVFHLGSVRSTDR